MADSSSEEKNIIELKEEIDNKLEEKKEEYIDKKYQTPSKLP